MRFQLNFGTSHPLPPFLEGGGKSAGALKNQKRPGLIGLIQFHKLLNHHFMCYSWNDHQEFKTNLIKNIYNKSPPDKNGNSRHCGNDLLPGELWPEQDKPWGDFNFCPRFILIVLISTERLFEQSTWLDRRLYSCFSGPGRPRLSPQRRCLESFWFQGMIIMFPHIICWGK